MTLTLENPSPARSADDRISRLSDVSLRRVVEPDEQVPGHVRDGQIVADELLSVAGLGFELSPEQRAVLSREETAAITRAGIALEGMLIAALGMYVAEHPRVTDPRVVYALHEMGEETRHSRLFVRLVDQLAPQAVDPFAGRLGQWLMRRIARAMQKDHLMMAILVLAGEEIPDLIAKRAIDHPDSDDFLRAVNTYHRQEEARHIAFARVVLGEFWAGASRRQRLRAKIVLPLLIQGLFEMLVHPGVYAAVGLPAWRTWVKVNASEVRRALRHDSSRPVLRALVAAGAFDADHVPSRWRRLTGLTRSDPGGRSPAV